MAGKNIPLPMLFKDSFQRWKFEVGSALRSAELYEVVMGEEGCPEDAAKC